tara:strand:+ start:341 stop:646 length:306 start_codon:yes stop_codon:yes gene_type:complete
MYKKSNIEGVYVKGNTLYRIEPHIQIELSEGRLMLTTYDPHPVDHDIYIDQDTILKNNTNTDQYIYTDGMVGPVAKQVQKEIIIHKGIERKERVRPTESVI